MSQTHLFSNSLFMYLNRCVDSQGFSDVNVINSLRVVRPVPYQSYSPQQVIVGNKPIASFNVSRWRNWVATCDWSTADDGIQSQRGKSDNFQTGGGGRRAWFQEWFSLYETRSSRTLISIDLWGVWAADSVFWWHSSVLLAKLISHVFLTRSCIIINITVTGGQWGRLPCCWSCCSVLHIL